MDSLPGPTGPKAGFCGGTEEARRAHLLLRRLSIFYAAFCAAAAGAFLVPAAAAPLLADGTALLCLGPALLCLTGLLAANATTRLRWLAARTALPPVMSGRRRFFGRLFRRQPPSPGRFARSGQGTLVPLLAASCALAVWALGARLRTDLAAADVVSLVPAVMLLLLAFPALVAERAMAAVAARTLPEAAPLRRLLLLPVAGLTLAALACYSRAAGLPGTVWIAVVVSWLLLAILAELALRALARWFVPAPADTEALASVDSLLLALLCGAAVGRGPAEPIRSHFGLDFSRSWALVFLRAAALPMLLLTGALCWGLAGVTVLPLDRRGVYERLGAPVAVLGPGAHVVLPWPFGRVRPVELGVVHALALGDGATSGPSAPTLDLALSAPGLLGDPAPAAGEQAAARDPEGPAPAEADRLWGVPHPTEAEYLIASASQGGQAFQTVSADIRVLYRIGAGDDDARAALYAAADPETVVRAAANRLVTGFFAAHTLDAVLARPQDDIADTLQAALARDLAGTGLEVVAVVVEAVHPPAGAADAYHGVQAAEIAARTDVAAEQGRARGSASGAREEAHRLLSVAAGDEGEMTGLAKADAARFAADRAGAAAGGRAFLLERYFADLAAAVARTPLTLVDHRIGTSGPIIDLRRLAAPVAGPEDPD